MSEQSDQHSQSSHAHSETGGIVSQLSSSHFSVSQAVGGPRGAVESLLPSLVFVLVFTISRNLTATIISCAVVSVICFVARLIQRQKVTSVLIGFVLAIICLLSAGMSKDARNFYVPGFFINGAWAVALLISIVVGFPAVAIVCELALGIPARQWKQFLSSHRDFRRACVGATWLWVALFVVRLAAEIPLWTLGLVIWLGTVRLVTGVPLFVIVLWTTWLIAAPRVSVLKSEQTRQTDQEVQQESTDQA